jgi:hypothetical protein
VSVKLDFLRPYTCEKIRLGSKYDGGYVLPKSVLSATNVLVTFGISTNFDFEQEYLKKNQNAQVIMLDPYIGMTSDIIRLIKRIFRVTKPSIRNLVLRKLYNERTFTPPLYIQVFHRLFHWLRFYIFTLDGRVNFMKKGIASQNSKNLLSVDQFWHGLSLDRNRGVLLKIDIEGNEYQIFRQLIEKLDNVVCLLIEVHDVNSKMSEIEDFILKSQEKGLYLVHIHGNNSDVADQYGIPNTLELTLAKELYLGNKCFDTRELPDKDLDAPCNPCYEDYALSFLN